MIRREFRNEVLQIFEAVYVLGDELLVDKAIADQDMRDAIEQGDIAARLDREMDVGHHGRFGNAWINNDEGAALIALKTLAQDWVIVRNICANQQDDIGRLISL